LICCAAGSYAAPGSSSCSLCNPGTFSPLPGAAECSNCSINSFSDVPGASYCTPCANNSVSSEGASSCTFCPKDSIPQKESKLFAIVGGNQCSENLAYGVLPTMNSYYLSYSSVVNFLSDTWLQVVTTDGSTERFRVLWKFRSVKTMTQRLVDAVAGSERVTWTVTKVDGSEFTYSADWWFSDNALITDNKFSGSSGSSLSYDDGAWGGGSTTVNGNAANVPSNFWGIANFNGGDDECSQIYENGMSIGSFGSGKTYMYNVGLSRCLQCPTGTGAYSGALTCCAAGEYLPRGSNICKTCGPGTYSLAGAEVCSPCAAGTYAQSGANSCLSCSSGTNSYVSVQVCFIFLCFSICNH
jgi:hypothetical protein